MKITTINLSKNENFKNCIWRDATEEEKNYYMEKYIMGLDKITSNKNSVGYSILPTIKVKNTIEGGTGV